MNRIALLCAVIFIMPLAFAKGSLSSFTGVGSPEQMVVVPMVTGSPSASMSVKFDSGFTVMSLKAKVAGIDPLSVTGVDFYCGRAGEEGSIAFDIFNAAGITKSLSGQLKGTLANEDENPSDDCISDIGRPVDNLVSLAYAMKDGLIYVVVRTTGYVNGVVRGQIGP